MHDKAYENVVQIYQALINQGVSPQVALELTNQKVAEKGYTGFVSGDNKKFSNAAAFAKHLVDWHGRMYPDSLKAKNFNQFYQGINGPNVKYKYNSKRSDYREWLEKVRPGVKKRINQYRQSKGQSPLAMLDNYYNPYTDITPYYG